MPIVVACPGCPAKLSAPESAAGKHIRCPRCGATAPVPAFLPAEEVPVVDAAVVPKPKPKPAAVDDDEDDEDDDRPRKKRPRAADDKPRRKKKRKAGGGSGGGAVALVVCGLLLVGAVATGAVLLARKGTTTAGGTGTESPLEDIAKKTLGQDAPMLPTDPPAAVPAGWQRHDFPTDRFRAYFPVKPLVGTKHVSAILQGNGGPEPPRVVQAPYTEMTYTAVGGPPDNTFVEVTVVRHPEGVPPKFRATLAGTLAKLREGGPNPAQARGLRWLGRDAVEMVEANVLRRIAILDDHTAVVVAITGPNGQRAAREYEAGFFSNFELTK